MTLKTHLDSLIAQHDSYLSYMHCTDEISIQWRLLLAAEIIKLNTEIAAIQARPIEESDREVVYWSAESESKMNKAYNPGFKFHKEIKKYKERPEPKVMPWVSSTWSRFLN